MNDGDNKRQTTNDKKNTNPKENLTVDYIIIIIIIIDKSRDIQYCTGSGWITTGSRCVNIHRITVA